jgi:hypothetical protein
MQKRTLDSLQYVSRRGGGVQQPQQAFEEDFETVSPFGYAGLEKQKGFFSRLKEEIVDLLFEAAEKDRPIGISQLTKQTFAVTDQFAGRSVYKQPSRTFQDYRFNQLVDSGQRY